MNQQSAQTITNHLNEARSHLIEAVNEATNAEERDTLREGLRDLEGLITTGLNAVTFNARDWTQRTNERSKP